MNFVNGNVKGADVSFYQDIDSTPQQIDFTKMVGQGASFVIIRAGQARPDPDFYYNWQHAKDAGLPRGSYWFYDSRVDPEFQAEMYVSLVENDLPELELFLDLEENYGGPYPGYWNWRKFLDRVNELIPVKQGIYTGYYYITGKIPKIEYDYFSQYSLWISWYTGNANEVLIPQPWTEAKFWQWGTPPWGFAWGCESVEIDQNLFNGTKEEFESHYNVTVPVPPEGETMAEKYKVIWSSGCNIRTAPNTSAPVVGVLPFGTEFDVVEHSIPNSAEDWGKTTTNTWVALKYNNQVRATLIETPPPPTGVTKTHDIEVYSDGSLKIDGNPYP